MQIDATTLLDRVRGCIIGGAIGDAMVDLSKARPGRFDSTTTTTGPSLMILSSPLQPANQSARRDGSLQSISPLVARWFRSHRLTGLGSSTLKALRDLDAGLHWALAGAKGEMSAGNGAAMRIAPLAFHLDPANPNDRQLIRDVSRITHHNEEAYAGR